MRCPECKSLITIPIKSRHQCDSIKQLRKYRCTKCEHQFFTMEEYEKELEKLMLEYQMEIEDSKDVFMWLWRSIYTTSMNDATIKDLRWNIDNYTSQTMKSKLKRLIS